MPCCQRTPFEVPRTDRMATDVDLVTCLLVRQTNWGVILVLVMIAVAWGEIIYLIGGTDALGFYLRAILVLSAFSVGGAAIGWIFRKFGGSINE